MSVIATASLPTTGARRKMRALAVLGGAAAALVVWAVAEAFGADLRQPSFGNGGPQQLGAGFVIVAAVVGGLAGWAVIVLLERLTMNPRRAWSIVAPSALLFSFSGPLSGHGITGGNRLTLALMHIAVAAVVIPVYGRTTAKRGLPRRKGRA